MIRKEAWLFYRTSSGVRLCWELGEPQGRTGLGRDEFASRSDSYSSHSYGPWERGHPHTLQWYVAHKKQPSIQQGHKHSPSVGSHGVAVSDKRGTPVVHKRVLRSSMRTLEWVSHMAHSRKKETHSLHARDLSIVQGFLPHKKPPPLRTLQQDHAWATTGVLGG